MNIKRSSGVELEQFYTNREEAARLINGLRSQPWFRNIKTFIEPSAGSGAFSDLIPGTLAIDIAPAKSEILKADFLAMELSTIPSQTLFFGNPPFGRQSSLALKFMKKSCALGDCVAFILPLSFEKQSVQDKVPLTHSLVYSEVLPDNIFHSPDGKPLAVKCCFQVWKKQPRSKVEKIKSAKVIFTTKGDHDFSIRRVGGTAGTIKTGRASFEVAEVSHYFVKLNGLDKEQVISALSSARWETADLAAGPRSISTQDIIRKISELGFAV